MAQHSSAPEPRPLRPDERHQPRRRLAIGIAVLVLAVGALAGTAGRATAVMPPRPSRAGR